MVPDVVVQASEVFTPNDYPLWTYVERRQDFEKQVFLGLKTPNIIISISGPSKSGKSVLLQKVVGKDLLIRIFGPQITEPEGLWSAVLDWIGTPVSSTAQDTQASTGTSMVGGQGSFRLVGVGGVSGKAEATTGTTTTGSKAFTYGRSGMRQVQHEIGSSDYAVFVDDFHYMPRELQVEVAKQLKAATEMGIKICTASVPHRSDDVVRANPELRGRVQAVDMAFWEEGELAQIAERGFRTLNMDVSADFISRLAVEACGSPQLMQSLCLQTCFRMNVFETCSTLRPFAVSDEDMRRILETTSATTDFSKLVEAMHVGPKLRGQERNEFSFKDGTVGDVYRAVLLAIASDPPVMSITYNALLGRIAAVCADATKGPVGSNVSEACTQIDKIAKNTVAVDTGVQGTQPIEWDKTADVENLHIAEPYFLFYLRASSKLRSLGHATSSQKKGPTRGLRGRTGTLPSQTQDLFSPTEAPSS